MNGFLKQFITPLLKATKGRQTISFFTVQDYKAWSEEVEDAKKWKIKYYKGLGTSTDKEAQQYFEDLVKHKIDFEYVDEDDDQALELVFSKKKIEKRKQWLTAYDPNAIMVYDRPQIRYKEFVDKELIHFSNEDNIRSIASIIDGFKPGQRKIIYACFKRNLKQEIKVAQLSGYVAEHSAYHHGEMSLTQTIVGMAQNFVGSNNINLLMPNGQFGSRNQGGKDHASARYIFTCLNKITRFIYPEPDDHTLNYVEDDGQLVEPEYYMPIIPMGLINGCQGIGTGWSTYVPNFNPRQIAELIIKKLQNNENFQNVHPWFKGFIGQIISKPDLSNYEVKGIIEIDAQNSVVHIKQLPIGRWIKDHKMFLEELIEKDERLVGLREYHTKNRVHFEVEVKPELIENHQDDLSYFEKMFKTTSSISMKNMVGFNSLKNINRYSKVSEVLEEFYEIRLAYYCKRKQYLVSRLQRQLQILTMKERFILEVVEQKLIIRNVKKVKLCEILKATGYKKYSDLTQIKTTKKHAQKGKKSNNDEGEEVKEVEREEGAEGDGVQKDSTTEYNYLLGMSLWSLTYEKVEQIIKQKENKEKQLKVLVDTKVSDIWKSDLVEFLKVLDEVEKEEQEEMNKGGKNAKHDGKQKRARKKVDRPKKQKKGGPINWDSDTEGSKSKEKVKNKNKEKKQSAEKNNKRKRNSEKTERVGSKEKSREKNKEKSSRKGKGEEKAKQKGKKSTKSEDDEDDFLSRVKKRMNDKSEKADENLFESGIITRPKKVLKTMSDIGKDDESNYDVVRVVKKSKKFNMDSDESDYDSIEDEQSDD